jgi:hypothetical protein
MGESLLDIKKGNIAPPFSPQALTGKRRFAIEPLLRHGSA